MTIEKTLDTHQAKHAPFARPAPTAVVKWYGDAVERYYGAYLVRVTARSGSILDFHFLRATDSTDVPGGPHRIDLSNVRFVWRDEPSTVDNAVPGAAECGFLFLNTNTIRTDTAVPQAFKDAMTASGGGTTGKYPRSAEISEWARILRTASEKLRKDLQGQDITPEIRRVLGDVDDFLIEEDRRSQRLRDLVAGLVAGIPGQTGIHPDSNKLVGDLHDSVARER